LGKSQSGSRRTRLFTLGRACSAGVVLLLLALMACSSPGTAPGPPQLPTRAPTVPAPSPTAIGARSYLETGRQQRLQGNVDAAIRALSEALALEPTLAPAYIERGALYLALGQRDRALVDAQAAVQADPENGLAYVLLGEVLRRGFEDPVRALEAYEWAGAQDPTLAQATFPARWQAATAANAGDRLLALAEEYQRTHSDDSLAAVYRGRALLVQGNPRSAIAVLVQSLQEHNGPAAAWYTLADAYQADGAWSEARICYEQAQQLAAEGDRSLYLLSDSPQLDLLAGLGAAYLYAGECITAQAALEEVLAAEPQRTDIHTLIGRALICQTPTPTPIAYPSVQWEDEE